MITFEPTTPPIRQARSWTCSAVSLAWALSAIGRPTTEDEAVELLGSGRVSERWGLLNGDGSGLVEVLAEQGYNADHGWLDWPSALEIAGTRPLLIGGGAWNHWSPVRGRDGDTLLLANPSPGHRGVWDVMTRWQWPGLGPFAGVWVAVDNVAGAENPATGLTTALAHLVDVVLAPLDKSRLSVATRRGILAEARRIREQFLGSPGRW